MSIEYAMTCHRSRRLRLNLNKLHYSVHGRTLAEMIVEHEDVSKDKVIITST